MRVFRSVIIFLFLALGLPAAAVNAAEGGAGSRTIRAGVFVNPPFVMERAEGGYEGMAVELWNEVAAGLGFHTEYVQFHDVREMLDAAREGKIDAVVVNLATSHERARYLKYSYPWYDSGLRILVDTRDDGSLWSALLRYRHYRVYALFLAIILGMAAVMTLLRRRRDPDFPGDWKTGLSLSFLNVLDSALSGKMEQRHLGKLGNLFFVAWLLFGMAAVAYFTSSMTSAMTSSELGGGDIGSVADLPGKKVGVLHGSEGEEFFAKMKTPARSYRELGDAVAALEKNELDAVVMDAPSLEYLVRQNPDRPLAVVGDLFHPEKYCFAAGYAHADLMDEVTVELIRLRENHRIDQLKDKYFAEPADGEEELWWPE